MTKKREITLESVKTPEAAYKQIMKYNSLVSDTLGIGMSESDPIENITSMEKTLFASAARKVYRSLDLVQRIIDDPPEQALRHGYKIETNYDDLGLPKSIQNRLDDLQFNEKALQFMINSRLYSRGGLMVPVMRENVMNPDRSHYSQELRLPLIEKVEGLNVIQEDFFDYHIQSYDPLAVNFNAIEWLRVQGTAIHPSRSFMSILSLDPQRQRGISVLDRIMIACKGINIAEWTITNLMLRYRALLVTYPAQEVENYTAAKKSAIQQMIQDIKMKFSSKSVASVPDNFTFEYLQTSFTGLKEATDFLYAYLASVTKMPQSIIKGSAQGELASAEKDERTYQDVVKAEEQGKKLEPLLQYVIQLLLNEKSGDVYEILAGHGIQPNDVDISIEFEPMLSVNPLQKSQIQLMDTQRGILEQDNGISTNKEVRADLHPNRDPLEPTEAAGEDNEALQKTLELFGNMGIGANN